MRAIIGLGTNLGDRLGALREATRRLGRIARIESASRVYETAPVGPPQPDYLNAALRIDYAGEPLDLLDVLQGIEVALGRVRRDGERWAPRTIDLDILWIDGIVIESDRLVVPHPHLVERAFALRPLLDVAADAIDPISQLPYARLVDHEAAMLRPTQDSLLPS